MVLILGPFGNFVALVLFFGQSGIGTSFFYFFWSIICLDISVDLLIAIFMLVIVSMIENLFV